jgi:hypothetical protein
LGLRNFLPLPSEDGLRLIGMDVGVTDADDDDVGVDCEDAGSSDGIETDLDLLPVLGDEAGVPRVPRPPLPPTWFALLLLWPRPGGRPRPLIVDPGHSSATAPFNGERCKQTEPSLTCTFS